MKFKDLVNPGIDTIHPYEPGRSQIGRAHV